jgi:hypothetical protein
MFRPTIDAAVVRLIAALQVLREAPPNLLVLHADALNVALETIEELVIEVEQSAEPLGPLPPATDPLWRVELHDFVIAAVPRAGVSASVRR